ncbi:hypothetical protein [Streptomyces sp. NPDC007355]|uniref:hypothetical protein n=1 Tax=Streptomyces sp. NPDC007355 TaxID=3364778 RepID=UPI0036796D9F
MQITGVDIYVNHPVLRLGATDWVPLSLALNPALTASRDTHVAVRVQPQGGLIKVRLFTPPDDPQTQRPDPEFTTNFDGPSCCPTGASQSAMSSSRPASCADWATAAGSTYASP